MSVVLPDSMQAYSDSTAHPRVEMVGCGNITTIWAIAALVGGYFALINADL